MPKIFVYGPDSLQARVYDKVGKSDVVGSAIMGGHILAFDKPNMKRKGEGLANARPDQSGIVFGVLYDLKPRQVEMLAGYYGGYEKRGTRVVLQPEDEEGTISMKSVECAAFFARRSDTKLRPSKESWDATVAGAEENKAPPTFMEMLKAMEVLDG